jgi:hypothetical protein
MGARLTQNRRWWLGGGAMAAVLLVLVGWFLVIEPQLADASSTNEQTESIQAQNLVLEGSNTKLKVQNDNIATLRTDLAAALAELPSDGGLPEFTRQLSAQATAASVVLNSVVVGPATAIDAPASSAGGTAAGSDGAENSGTGSTANPAAPGAAAADSSSGLVQMTVTVTATGLGADNLAFLQAIQMTGPRRALVTASQLAPADNGGDDISASSTLTVTLTIFSAPLAPADQVALEKLLSGG